MDIAKIRKKKLELELKIEDVINKEVRKFTEETDEAVEYFTFNKIYEMGLKSPIAFGVKIDMRI